MRQVTSPRGFSLLELMIVLAITFILTGLLFPALQGVRESANRLLCASNQRGMGYAMTLWATDHNEQLPKSKFQLDGRPQEMMAATVGGEFDEPSWEGIGWLIGLGYLDSPEACFCPSHTGEHPYEKYEGQFIMPCEDMVYTNYHYAGHLDSDNQRPLKLSNDHETILLADGIRTKSDFNHVVGTNLLHGDGAITWFVLPLTQAEDIPTTEIDDFATQQEVYEDIWSLLNEFDD